MFLTQEQRRECLSVIDRLEWKHSLHMPQCYDGVDWGSDVTLYECQKIVMRYEADAVAFADACKRVRGYLESVLKCRAENDKETTSNE